MRGLVCGNACALEVWCAKIKEGGEITLAAAVVGIGKSSISIRLLI